MYQEKETAIMFTGGQDSTAAACALLEEGRNVHLLSFNNGLCIRLYKPSERIKELKKFFGNNKITHNLIDSQEAMKFLKSQSTKLVKKHKSPLIFDLICRFAMEMNTILYCKKNNVPSVADGNNVAQNQIFMQQKEYLDVSDAFYAQFGIESLHPVFFSSTSRQTNLKILAKYNFNEGYKCFEKLNVSSQMLNQPFCFWAPVSFLFTSPLRKLGFEKILGLKTEDAIEIRKYLQNHAKTYIEERI